MSSGDYDDLSGCLEMSSGYYDNLSGCLEMCSGVFDDLSGCLEMCSGDYVSCPGLYDWEMGKIFGVLAFECLAQKSTGLLPCLNLD